MAMTIPFETIYDNFTTIWYGNILISVVCIFLILNIKSLNIGSKLTMISCFACIFLIMFMTAGSFNPYPINNRDYSEVDLSPEIFDKAAHSEDKNIRYSILFNPSVPIEAVELLAQDPNKRVREKAIEQLNSAEGTVRKQFAAFKAGNYELAYSYTSPNYFQKLTSLEAFRNLFEQEFKIQDVERIKFVIVRRASPPDTRHPLFAYIYKDKTVRYIEFDLNKRSDGSWKINRMDVL